MELNEISIFQLHVHPSWKAWHIEFISRNIYIYNNIYIEYPQLLFFVMNTVKIRNQVNFSNKAKRHRRLSHAKQKRIFMLSTIAIFYNGFIFFRLMSMIGAEWVSAPADT